MGGETQNSQILTYVGHGLNGRRQRSRKRLNVPHSTRKVSLARTPVRASANRRISHGIQGPVPSYHQPPTSAPPS
jgi:hypothetical protein